MVPLLQDLSSRQLCSKNTQITSQEKQKKMHLKQANYPPHLKSSRKPSTSRRIEARITFGAVSAIR